jgi:hypothetical protein
LPDKLIKYFVVIHFQKEQKMSVKTVYVTSENLIKDLAFKQRLGLKADLIDEALAVVEHALEKFNDPELHAKGVQTEGKEV